MVHHCPRVSVTTLKFPNDEPEFSRLVLQTNPLGECWFRGECYMFDMATYSGPQSLTVPIYGYIMPILGWFLGTSEN